MAQGLFIVGFTVAEVVLIQSAAKEMLMEGKTLMSWADGNSNATRQFAMPVKEVLAVRPGTGNLFPPVLRALSNLRRGLQWR